MKFLIIGTGGVGGCIGGFLAASGEDVTLIARGAHLDAMRKNGLRLHTDCRGELLIAHPQAMEMDDYHATPDVIFVCVKGYSLAEAERLIARVATPQTVILPVLNVVGTGAAMSEHLPGLSIADGCIYIFSQITAPGEIEQRGRVFRVIYGERDGSHPEILDEIAAVLVRCGISVTVSDQIGRDCMEKFACVSPMAAAGSYYDVPMGILRADPAMRADFLGLVREVIALTDAMGLSFERDLLEDNRKRLDSYAPDTTASMQRDLKKGGSSELDGLVFEPVRLGRRYGVPTPLYEKIAQRFGFEE